MIEQIFQEVENKLSDLFDRVSQLEAAPTVPSGGGGGGAPADAEYLVNSADATLTNEIVVTAAQGRIIYGDGTPTWTTLNIGTVHQILKVDGASAIPEWASFDWDNISSAAGADMVHDHSTNAEGGEIPLASLGSYTRGDLIVGGIADWEDLAIGANNTILFSDGTDPSWQTFSSAGIAPNDAEYLVLTLTDDLTQERRLDFSTNFSTTDGGANNDYDVDLSNTTVAVGAYGNATNVATFTVDAKGRLTAAANVAISGVPPLAHTVLGIYHSDTTTDTVSRGSLIYGNSTPLWDELIHPGNANRILTTDANDVLWSTNTLNITGNSTINGSLVGNITGGGTIATGGFTLTIPATGTAVLGTGSNNRVTYWTSTNTVSSDVGLQVDATNDLYIVADAGGIGNSNTTARLGFDSSGGTDYAYFEGCKVGIGTTRPDYTLDVRGSGDRRIQIKATRSAFLFIDSDQAGGNIWDAGIIFKQAGTNKWSIYNDVSDSQKFKIKDDGDVRLTVQQDGNVGISETSPDYRLDVAGVIGVDDNGSDPSTVAGKATFYGVSVSGVVSPCAQDEAGNRTILTSTVDGIVALGAGTSSATSSNDISVANHTHNITTTSDGASLHNTILQSNANGQLTLDDLFLTNGGLVGPSGAQWLFNITNGISTTARLGVGITLPNAKTHIDQSSSTGAIPVLKLDQGDTSEQCIEFSSDGVDRDINLFTVDVTGTPKMYWDESYDALRWEKQMSFDEDVAIGGNPGGVPAILWVNQTNTTLGGGAMRIDQDDQDEPFITFDGYGANNATLNISDQNGDGVVDGPKNYSSQPGWSFVGMIRMQIGDNNSVVANGDYWIPIYENDTA